jgi:sugar lactone lactonase YvrE
MKFLVSLATVAIGVGCAQEYRLSTLVSGTPPIGPLPALDVSVGHVGGVATDRSGNVYFSSMNGCVFKLDPKGSLWRVAGVCQPGYSGDGGPATAAKLSLPSGLTVDSTGSLYIADYLNCVVRKVAPSGTISTVAGNGSCYSDPALGGLSYPTVVAVNSTGQLFVADSSGIWNASPGGGLTAVAALSCSGLAFNAAGDLFAAQDFQVFRIANGQVTPFAGSATPGVDSGDGGPALSATFGFIMGLTVDDAGDAIVADGTIRSIAPDGTVRTVADNSCCNVSGSPIGFGDVAADPSGNIYVGDVLGDTVRKISPQGVVTAAAGADNPSYVGDNGPSIDAQLSTPQAVAVDASGNVYVADFGNSRVRKISTSGLITTVAGNGTAGFSGDGGPATSAQLAGPDGLAVDAAGNLFVAEYANNRVRKVTPDGIITTFAGGPCCNLGDGAPATSAYIPLPHGIAVDGAGNLYVAEWPDSRIRKVTPSGMISTFAGTGTRGFSGDGGPATQAQLNCPWGLAADENGNLTVADSQNLLVRRIAPNGIITTIPDSLSRLPGPAVNGVAVDSAGDVFTSTGWRISPVAEPSLISVGSRSGPFTVNGVAIAAGAHGNLFLVNGNQVLSLQPVVRPSLRRQ